MFKACTPRHPWRLEKGRYFPDGAPLDWARILCVDDLLEFSVNSELRRTYLRFLSYYLLCKYM